MEFLFIASMEKKQIENKSICHFCSFSILHLSSRKALKEKKMSMSLLSICVSP